MKTFKAKENDVNRILFKYLIKMMGDVPISRIEKLFRQKDIKVNGKRNLPKTYKIQFGDVVVVYGVETNHKKTPVSTIINFTVVYEDDNILIVNKPDRTAMHSENDSLDNQVIKYLKHTERDSFIPSHVGRLDKVTTGIALYAKNYKALVELNAKQSHFRKIYMFRSDLNKEIETQYYLTKDILYQRMKVVKKPNKHLAITKFYFDGSKKLAEIITGKKHQIRVSLSKLGYPIYGDVKYGGKKMAFVYLHCYQLYFNGLENGLEYLNGEIIMSKPKW